MRTLTTSIVLHLLGLAATLVSTTIIASDERPPVDGAEQRSSLFVAGQAKPAAVPAQALERVDASLGGAEVLYSRWVQMGDFDPMTAKSGDRIRIEIIPGESFELVVSRVSVGRHSGTRFLRGRFENLDDDLSSSLLLVFEPNGIFSGGRLYIPLQARQILFKTDPALAGWARVSEIRPGTGPQMGNDLDIVVDESETKETKEPETAKH